MAARANVISNLVKSQVFLAVWARLLDQTAAHAAKYDREARLAANNGHAALAMARLAKSAAVLELLESLKSLPTELAKEEKEPQDVRSKQPEPVVVGDFGV